MNFWQALFPDGRRRAVSIDLPGDIEIRARLLTALGWDWWVECHPDRQQVILWAERSGAADADKSVLEACPNGPEVPVAIARLVTRVWASLEAEEASLDGSGD